MVKYTDALPVSRIEPDAVRIPELNMLYLTFLSPEMERVQYDTFKYNIDVSIHNFTICGISLTNNASLVNICHINWKEEW